MSRRVSLPLANCKVAFSRAALRHNTADSACSKWCPSAQKHFRVWKNTGRAYHGTFKPPLYRRDCVLWRDHKRIRPGGMCTQQHKHSCLDALLLLRTFFVPLAASHSFTLKFPAVFTCHTTWGLSDTHIPSWTSGHPHSGECVCLQMDKTCSVDRLISNQWLQPVTLRSSMPSLSSSFPSRLDPPLPAAQTWQPLLFPSIPILFNSCLSSLLSSLLLLWQADECLT